MSAALAPACCRPALRAALLSAILLAGCAGLPGQVLAAGADCKQLFDLYRTCHRYGVEADSSLACLESCYDAMNRAVAKLGGRNSQANQVLVELVCSTGCDDAVSLREPATRQEFLEAFCDGIP